MSSSSSESSSADEAGRKDKLEEELTSMGKRIREKSKGTKGKGKAAKEKKTKKKKERDAVVYLGHIPHGFFEEQMRGFFSQFGDVRNLRLSRSKKTGRSRGYAFIEFESQEVAKIVAATMNNYLLSGRCLQCHILDAADVHESIFLGSNRKFQPHLRKALARHKHNAERTEEQEKRAAERTKLKNEKKRKKLEELGIDYDIPEPGTTGEEGDGAAAKKKTKKKQKRKKQK
eukprot:g647.t1